MRLRPNGKELQSPGPPADHLGTWPPQASTQLQHYCSAWAGVKASYNELNVLLTWNLNARQAAAMLVNSKDLAQAVAGLDKTEGFQHTPALDSKSELTRHSPNVECSRVAACHPRLGTSWTRTQQARHTSRPACFITKTII